MFESLETRRLFAISLDAGLLLVEGNKTDDLISIYTTAAGTQVQIQRNLQTVANKTFKTSKIDLIKVFGKDGSDYIQMLAAIGSKNPKAKIFGGPGVLDQLKGGTGNDTIIGGPGQDACEGGPGNDLIKGNGAQDTCRGREGNDTLIGGAGANDLMRGDEGDDVIKAQDGNFDWCEGNLDNDTAFVDSEDNIGSDGDIETVHID